jgi:hypothetical protein
MRLLCGLRSYSDLDLTLTGELALKMEHEERLEVTSQPSSLNYALPFELLGEIFSHISEDPLNLRYAILVCRSWHNAVVHHANLWTNIILGYNFLAHFQGARLRDGDAFVRLCISRSSPLPLHISIGTGYKARRSGLGRVLYSQSFSLLKHILDSDSGELFRRCKSLSWTFDNIKVNGLSDADLAARAFISGSFPALEYMTIENLIASLLHPRMVSPRLPRLKEVTLINHSEEHSPFFHDDDFSNAERLAFIITFECDWMRDDVTYIRRFRNIRILILKGECKSACDDLETPYDKPVELCLLETLTLSGDVPGNILIPIRAPGLKKLEIEAGNTTECRSLVASNLVHLVGSVECLRVSFSELIFRTSWIGELDRLIAEAPSLVSVWVSPWVVRYLIGKEWRSKLHVTDPK